MTDEDLPTSPTSPLATFPAVLAKTAGEARPQEYYGFVAWITTYLAFIAFLLWAFLPDRWIQATGLYWYPNREWALLLPAYSIILCILTWWSYWALAIVSTPSFSELQTMTDSYTRIPKSTSDESPYVSRLAPDAIPELYDVPVGLINRVELGRRKRPKP